MTTAAEALATAYHDESACLCEGAGLCHQGNAASILAALAASGYQIVPAATLDRLRDYVEDAARQFGYWSDKAGGLWTGGLSTLEDAFDLLGWSDPQPMPDMRCDEPKCMRQGTVGWPTRPGGTGPNGGYRRTCYEHSDLATSSARTGEGGSDG